MSNLKGSPTCVDCGVLHGRDPRAALCMDCRDARLRKRRDTPKYRSYQTKWNRSPKGKLYKGSWHDAHREACLARLRTSHKQRMAERGPKVATCATLLCEGTFTRGKGSRRLFCEDCQRANYGQAYARTYRSTPWRAA